MDEDEFVEKERRNLEGFEEQGEKKQDEAEEVDGEECVEGGG